MKSIFWPVLATCIVGLIGLLAYAFRPTAHQLDNYGPAPRIILTGTDNQTFDTAKLENNVWVVNFFFSSCPNVCGTLNGRMAALDREFLHEPRVHLLSITVDPDTDTPEKLREYKEQFKAATAKWHFLTGPLNTIKTIIVDQLHLASDEDPMLHSTRVLLIDSRNDIRGYYQGLDTESMSRLGADIRGLLRAP